MKTLKQAQDEMVAKAIEGTTCPCCGQTVKIYKIRIGATMAAALVEFFTFGGGRFIHAPTTLSSKTLQNRSYVKLRFWGLIEAKAGDDPSKKDSGFWRITPEGEAFVRGAIRVKSHANIYNGKCYGMTGTMVTFREIAASGGFDLRAFSEKQA